MSRIKFSSVKAAKDNRLPVLAIDLDGTLLEHSHPPAFGEPVRGIVEELNKLRANGWLIAIWTCRADSKELRDHLAKHEVPFDYINESSFRYPDSSEKIQADAYLDDKSVSFDGNTDGLAERIMYFKPWHEKK